MLPSPEELPPLWQKPAFSELSECLKTLRLSPPVWNIKAPSREDSLEEEAATAHDRREIVMYLSGIVKSSLAWIDDEAQKEQIWDEASKRLSERCGRTAMGEIVRRWPFGTNQGASSAFELTIREPALTGDALGLKTWGSSYALAQLLPQLASGPLLHLFPSSPTNALPSPVLELGSGTGLLGLAAACAWRAAVVLTDLPAIVPNLRHNAELNRDAVEALGGCAEAAPLTWGGGGEAESDPRFAALNQYKIVLAADPLYDDDHPRLLAGVIDAQMSLDTDARAVVMVPQRDHVTKDLTSAFVKAMAGLGCPLICSEQGTEPGQDDWGDDQEAQPVACWWGIFRRAQRC